MPARERDLFVWTSEGAVVKRALRIECSSTSCRASRALEGLDYRARFGWWPLSPERGSVFLDLPSLRLLCVRLRARARTQLALARRIAPPLPSPLARARARARNTVTTVCVEVV